MHAKLIDARLGRVSCLGHPSGWWEPVIIFCSSQKKKLRPFFFAFYLQGRRRRRRSRRMCKCMYELAAQDRSSATIPLLGMYQTLSHRLLRLRGSDSVSIWSNLSGEHPHIIKKKARRDFERKSTAGRQKRPLAYMDVWAANTHEHLKFFPFFSFMCRSLVWGW